MNNENKIVQPECPEESELQNYLDGNLSLTQTELVEQHLAVCDRCYLMLKVLEPSDFDDEYEPEGYEPAQKLPEWMDGYALELADRQKKINANKRTLEQVQKNGGVKFAQMWKPKTDNILLVTPEGNEYHSFIDFDSVPHFVVVVTNENDKDAEKLLNHKLVWAFPIHDEEDLINGDDLLLRKENSPTGYSFFIQSWNRRCKILVDNLDVCIGEINFQGQEELAKKLKKLGQKLQTEKVNPYSTETEDNIPEIGVDKRHFKKNYKTDPLIRYRYKEFKETAYLRVPAESLRETAALEATPQMSFWERFLTLISAYNLQGKLLPTGAIAGLLVIAGLIYWLSPSISQINVPEIAEGNRNVAQPIMPDKQNNSPNFNSSNISNSNSTEKLDSNSNNQNTNGGNFNNEKQKNTNFPQNRTNKKNSLSNPKEEQKKEQKKEQENRQLKQAQLPQEELAIQETPKFAEDIGELPPSGNGATRSPNSEYRNFFLSPSGTFVKTTKPTLSWSRRDGIEKYKVVISDYRGNEITSDYVDGNSWTSDKELVPGGYYRWKVIPVDKNKVAVPIGNQPLQGFFKVLNNIPQRRVVIAEKTEQSPSLKLARVYLENKLLADAITELESYLTTNPNSKEAKRLLDFAKNPAKLTNPKKN